MVSKTEWIQGIQGHNVFSEPLVQFKIKSIFESGSHLFDVELDSLTSKNKYLESVLVPEIPDGFIIKHSTLTRAKQLHKLKLLFRKRYYNLDTQKQKSNSWIGSG